MTSRKRYSSSIDVAQLAGVSQSAVSRTYREGASVSEETRRKVLEAATALDYRPSMIPRIMLTHRSYLVAVVVGGLYNPFYANVLEIFSARLQEAGYLVLLIHTDSGHTLDDIIPRLSSYRVDAIVSALAVMSGAAAQDLARLKDSRRAVQCRACEQLGLFRVLRQSRGEPCHGSPSNRARRDALRFHCGSGQQFCEQGPVRRLSRSARRERGPTPRLRGS